MNDTFRVCDTALQDEVVGQFEATDPENNIEIWGILSGNTGNTFSVNGSGGLVVENPAGLAGTFNLVVSVSDAGGLQDQAEMEIVVLDVIFKNGFEL